ncbi:MAG: AAA family ATPase [Candidatus Eremiobacteraeota bacterium]|nr:AAA family ATPase [Candidatus Eremiobacteraeota bacterium]
MYLKNIAIKNIGPIDELEVKFPFNKNKEPIPIVFVGENGTGKTILQSQIVDGMYEIGNKLFTDVLPDMKHGHQVYRISGYPNLQAGKDKGFAIATFIDDTDSKLEYFDKVGEVKKEDFTKLIPDFLPPNGKNTKEITNIADLQKKKLKDEFSSGAYFYQPAYRYEEPFWKNDSVLEDSRFQDNTRFSGELGKNIEIISSMKHIKSYLLDLVLDFLLYNKKDTDKIIWHGINDILRKIKQRKDIRFSIGPRGGNRVSIIEQKPDRTFMRQLVPSIDNLSLGESILLNLFVNILRHSDKPPKTFDKIKGIVVIDEIDVHLHTNLQYSVLPKLIKLFPKVQFILTTHSPIFLLGMKNVFGEDGFEIRNMPKGDIITTERFSEFEKAYETLRSTEKFEEDVRKQIDDSTKPILFVEGAYDVRYIEKAAKLLEKQALLEQIQIYDANGFGGLDKIWNNYNTKLSEVVPQKVLLLYDCDIKRNEGQKGKVFTRVIPRIDENLIEIGIENLFPDDTIKKAKDFNSAFIDYDYEAKKEKRGQEITKPEKYEVNKDEKKNLCDWLCENGDKNDFQEFSRIFSILEETLVQTQEEQ